MKGDLEEMEDRRGEKVRESEVMEREKVKYDMREAEGEGENDDRKEAR